MIHLREVVGLDASLNRCTIEDLTPEDWKHLVYVEQLFATFDNVEYALARARIPGREELPAQLLAVILEPSPEDLNRPEVRHFEFKGFDLIEKDGETSSLTNCEGFDDVFSSSELSDCGLLQNLDRAYDVRETLVQLYPEEPHADCAVWAVWRARQTV